jgi:hypothetical protein
MRIRVAVDRIVPLKKEWRVRATNGAFVTVNFKYEKLGVFCHRCRLIGHTDKVCLKLFELDSDDSVRNWGADLKPASQRIGTSATNHWLQDLIIATASHQNHVVGCSSTTRNSTTEGTMPVPSFNDRMLVVQNQITSIKHDVLAAQNATKAKQNAGENFS